MGTREGHRWFAAYYDHATRREPPAVTRLRREVAGVARGQVLELGAGTGGNFPFFVHVDAVAAVEPDRFMLARLRSRVDGRGQPVAVCRARAEALPFPDGSFDTVVAMLVLCSVADPARALAEARRVLRPGGVLRFAEHVRGAGALGVAHDLAAPLWARCAGGCRLNRHGAALIEAHGFRIEQLQRRRFAPGIPAIIGVAWPDPGH